VFCLLAAGRTRCLVGSFAHQPDVVISGLVEVLPDGCLFDPKFAREGDKSAQNSRKGDTYDLNGSALALVSVFTEFEVGPGEVKAHPIAFQSELPNKIRIGLIIHGKNEEYYVAQTLRISDEEGLQPDGTEGKRWVGDYYEAQGWRLNVVHFETCEGLLWIKFSFRQGANALGSFQFENLWVGALEGQDLGFKGVLFDVERPWEWVAKNGLGSQVRDRLRFPQLMRRESGPTCCVRIELG
jgi:hypothetical protein